MPLREASLPGLLCLVAVPVSGMPSAIGAAPIVTSAPSRTKDTAESLAGLRAADLRLAEIFYRLAHANRPLCDRQAQLSGLVLHRLTAYRAEIRDQARAFFNFASPVAVEAVLAGTPAAMAGWQAGDSILAIDGVPLDSDPLVGTSRARAQDDTVAIEAQIASASARHPVEIDISRAGKPMTLPLPTLVGCAGRAEVVVSHTLNAASGDMTIQVNAALMNLLSSDEDLAAVVAHELAHLIMHHPERLTAAGVDRGLMRDFGRNARLIRQTEDEADRLSVHLLANAGYNPASASQYLKRYRQALHTDSILAGNTHSRGRARVALLDREAADIAARGTLPSIPDWLETRSEPLR